MLPILIAYGTTEGHARKVAEFIAERLRIRGHRVDLVDTASPAALQVQPIYQGAIVGGSVHYDRHQTALTHFLKSNRSWLGALPLGFFSVSLNAALPDADGQAEARQAADACIADCGLQPVATCCVAGALKYAEFDFFKRLLARRILHKLGPGSDLGSDHEYTDWPQVEAFVDRYLHEARISG